MRSIAQMTDGIIYTLEVFLVISFASIFIGIFKRREDLTLGFSALALGLIMTLCIFFIMRICFNV